jgi:hypothetical protein
MRSTASGTYRYVCEQGTELFVSDIPLTQEEAEDCLDTEATLHRAAGWTVTVSGRFPHTRVECVRGETRRVVTVRMVP